MDATVLFTSSITAADVRFNKSVRVVFEAALAETLSISVPGVIYVSPADIVLGESASNTVQLSIATPDRTYTDSLSSYYAAKTRPTFKRTAADWIMDLLQDTRPSRAPTAAPTAFALGNATDAPTIAPTLSPTMTVNGSIVGDSPPLRLRSAANAKIRVVCQSYIPICLAGPRPQLDG